MKNLSLFIILISYTITQAQIVNIPDTNFKNALLNHNPAIDTNGDGEIQVNEAIAFSGYLNVEQKNIADLTGIEAFTNLTVLRCSGNNLSFLNVSNNTNLTQLYCHYNQLSNLDISNNPNLIGLNCTYNQLSNLDISNNINLIYLYCAYNQLSNLDISNNPNLTELKCSNNLLSHIDISNNSNLTYLNCSSNQLISLDVSNNPNLTYLNCYSNQLSSLDISNNLNLIDLTCISNQLVSLDVSINTNLTSLRCDNNLLTSLDVSNNTNLTNLTCDNNQLDNLDVSNNINLIYLYCAYNQFSSLDVSNIVGLHLLHCNNNPNLTYINLKNGNNDNLAINDYFYQSYFNDLPNLQSVCVDELNTNLTAYITTETGHAVTFTEYCSFLPAQSNTISGNIKLDLDNNGCDSADLSMANLMLISSNGTDSFATFTQNNGDYLLYTSEGDFTTQITSNVPNYYAVNPNLQTNTFTGFNNTFTADFCIVPNQTINNLNISLIPTSQARPGFIATYQIVYKNIGTTPLDGSVSLNFDDTKLNFLNASENVNTQTSNTLTFNYTNLNPFEKRTIDLQFNANTPFAPQPVNIGDVLSFIATVNPITGDNTPDNNTATLNQIVVGSYDPNDITCLEGNELLLADTDKFLHYVIRFQNTGTASAINVVVKNILDANLDWSTLQLESLSHNNSVAIKNGNKIEFIFENINLPDSTTDEPNSHGFIAYKIKPKTTIALGDVIPNKANIFFDYNEAIETNTATTTIVNVLAVDENYLLDFSVYPTPTENILHISSKTEIVKIEFFNKLGQKIKETTTESKIDVSNLTQGLYLVKVEDANGNYGVKKIVKK